MTVHLAGHEQIAPRAIFCVNEHAHSDRAVAEEVCAGRFPLCGITMDLGVEPDWLGAELPPDVEWRIDWSKFYYGRDLASAYCETGEQRFLSTWERLLDSWILQVPVGTDAADAHVPSRRIQNWVYAWATFASAELFPGLADGLDRRIVERIAAEARFIRDHLTAARNHRTIELYALFCVALSLPELDTDGELLAFSIDQLHRNLLDETRADGVHFEQSTHYHCVVLRSFLGVRENARRFALDLPDGFDEQLTRMCEFAMHCHRPDGGIPAFSDADGGSYLDLLALAADVLDRPDFLYVATGGEDGAPPVERYASFRDGGYFIQRSGWDRDARFLMFDCGPLGEGGHGHYDLLSFELAAGGRPLIVDPGRYSYSEHEDDPTGRARNLRHWFKGAAAHNTVVVDGLDQTPYRRKQRMPGDREAHGTFAGRLTAPGLDVLEGFAKSPSYEAVHRRRIWFVADEYWVIDDLLTGEEPHRYDLRFHLDAAAQGHVAVAHRGANATVRAPGIALVITPPRAVELEQGWVAPLYGVKEAAPVVTVAAPHTSVASFATLAAPLAPDAPMPTLRASRRLPRGDHTFEIDRLGPDGAFTDELRWSSRPHALRLGPEIVHARASWMRFDASGHCVAARACGVAGLDAGRGWERVGARGTWATWDAAHEHVELGGTRS